MSEKEILFVDTETYSNKAFLGARTESGREFRYWVRFAGENTDEIRDLIDGPYILVTFNGIYFDLPVIAAMYAGKSPQEIKSVANSIIQWNVRPWLAAKPFELAYKKVQRASHIDLIRVVTAPAVGLKMYGARMCAPSIIENPFHHEAFIEDSDEPAIERYCVEGDLDLTQRLFNELIKPIELRVDMSHRYGVDMRCKTDAQMAETIFVRQLGLSRNRATYIPEFVTYDPPAYLKFKDPAKNELVERIRNERFYVDQQKGHVILPTFLNIEVRSKTGRYKMGIGGLHSSHDKRVCHIAGDGIVIKDIDATSYYPTIMLLMDMVPKNLGREFLNEYRTIYDRRMVAKAIKDQSTMDTLRIALNGTFGKTADMFSPLYSPDLMIAIVLTGQLTLLHVIELLEEIPSLDILSANTDGIMIRYHDEHEQAVQKVLSDYTKNVGYTFEETLYRCVALKDVNNYFAVKMDRTLKTKGLYAKQDLRKNPSGSISGIAVQQWLAKGTPLMETIRNGELKDFLFARNVNKSGGCMYGEERLGNVVRWYKTTEESPKSFTYAAGGAKIARTDNSRALQHFIPGAALPTDLDYKSYHSEAVRIINDVGAAKYLSPEDSLLLPQPKRRKKNNV